MSYLEQMNQLETQVVALTKKGLAARKIQDRLAVTVSVRQVQRIQQKYLGKIAHVNNSRDNQIAVTMRPVVNECLRRLGKDWYTCEICGEHQTKKCDVHHTKYEGATIYDLQLVCRSCNLSRVNKGLS